MADILAGIAPQKDTYANWVTLNPTLGKTSGGNDYAQVIFATGSPVGDILLWGMAEKFIVAYAAGQYVIQQDEIIPTIPVDISAANTVITLPDITGDIQTRDFVWYSGDGSHTWSLAIPSDNATVGIDDSGTGLLATVWAGEGSGRMSVYTDGSNWQVREYEDYITDTDQKIWKHRDGTERQLLQQTHNGAINTVSGALYRSDLIDVITRSHQFYSIDSENVSIFEAETNNQVWVASTIVEATTASTAKVYLLDPASEATAYDYILNYDSLGRWRT